MEMELKMQSWNITGISGTETYGTYSALKVASTPYKPPMLAFKYGLTSVS